jgi:hypothetical protein
MSFHLPFGRRCAVEKRAQADQRMTERVYIASHTFLDCCVRLVPVSIATLAGGSLLSRLPKNRRT